MNKITRTIALVGVICLAVWVYGVIIENIRNSTGLVFELDRQTELEAGLIRLSQTRANDAIGF